MEKINTIEIESAFKDLIVELEKIKDLNSIASSLKESASKNQEVTDTLCSALREYYEHAMSVEKEIADYHHALAADIVSTKKTLETDIHYIVDLQENLKKSIGENTKTQYLLWSIVILLNTVSILLTLFLG